MTTTGLPPESSDAAAAEVVNSLVPAWLQLPGYRNAVALLIVAVGVSLSTLIVSLSDRPVAHRVERQSVAQIVLSGTRAGTIALAGIIADSIVGLQLGRYGYGWYDRSSRGSNPIDSGTDRARSPKYGSPVNNG
jgi:hypothetical protein